MKPRFSRERKPEVLRLGPPPKYIDRINVALEDRTSWNLDGTGWTRDTFLAELKKHSWIKIGGAAIVQVIRICDVRFFPAETDQYATKENHNCAEFSFD